jgi:putative hydrolase of the HAD superfamily
MKMTMIFKPFDNKTDIFFDLDHTLWDFEKNSALAFERVIDEMKMPFSVADFLSHYVVINEEYWHKYSLNLISHDELRVGRIRDTFQYLKYKGNTEEILQIGESYLKYLPDYNYLFDDALELLDYLQDKYRLHIITNVFDEVQRQKLINSGISHYFITVTNSELAGVKKPDAGIFTYALNRAKVSVGNSVMIGDNLLADIKGAQNVGMDVIYYNEHNKNITSDLVQVNKLIDIKGLL